MFDNMLMLAFADRMLWDLNDKKKEVTSLFISSSGSAPCLIARFSPVSGIYSISECSFPAENSNAEQNIHELVKNKEKEPSGCTRRRCCVYCPSKAVNLCNHKDCREKGLLFFCVGNCFNKHLEEMENSN